MLRLLSTQYFPKGIKTLTMPGLRWVFERQLLHNREGKKFSEQSRRPRKTYLACIEKEEELFRVAFKLMPGFTHGVVDIDPAPYATTTVRTYHIQRFHRADALTLMNYYVANESFDHSFHFVWLDFTGQLSMKRLIVIRRFWQKFIYTGGYLAITSQNGRWSGELLESIKQSGSIESTVHSYLGGRLIDDATLRYTGGHGTSMSHIVLQQLDHAQDDS